MTDGYLRFAHPNVGYVIDGLEDATVRLDLEREFAVGDVVELRTPGDTVFGAATVEDVKDCEVRHAWVDMWSDERIHPSTGIVDLLERLQGHYGDDVDLKTDVTVIYLDVEQIGQGPFVPSADSLFEPWLRETRERLEDRHSMLFLDEAER